MSAATLSLNWKQAITDSDGDDLPMLVYCDWLDENDGAELAAILREWINVRTPIRMSGQDAFSKMVANYNKENEFPDQEIIEPRKAWMNGRIGGCYTHLHTTAEYICKRPNLLSSQPFRSMTLVTSRASEAELLDVLTNWRLQKLWHLDISHYVWGGNTEAKFANLIRQMKPLPCLNELRLRGVRNVNFKVSSSLYGLKKIHKACKLYLGVSAKPVT